MNTEPIAARHAAQLFNVMNACDRVTAGLKVSELTREVISSSYLFNLNIAMLREVDKIRHDAFGVLYGNGWDVVKTSPGILSLVSRAAGLHQSLETAGSVGEGALPDEDFPTPSGKIQSVHQKPVTPRKKPVTGKLRSKK